MTSHFEDIGRSRSAHVSAMDVRAGALPLAERMIVDGQPKASLDARHAGWRTGRARDMNPEPQPVRSAGRRARSALDKCTDASNSSRPASNIACPIQIGLDHAIP